jgi:hypothetical protein
MRQIEFKEKVERVQTQYAPAPQPMSWWKIHFFIEKHPIIHTFWVKTVNIIYRAIYLGGTHE